jgi:hypothetical protein
MSITDTRALATEWWCDVTGIPTIADVVGIPTPRTVDVVATAPINHADERHKMMMRHHLVIQSLMNNISLSIRNQEPVDFKIKSLEITADRIRITGLDYTTQGTKDVR